MTMRDDNDDRQVGTQSACTQSPTIGAESPKIRAESPCTTEVSSDYTSKTDGMDVKYLDTMVCVFHIFSPSKRGAFCFCVSNLFIHVPTPR